MFAGVIREKGQNLANGHVYNIPGEHMYVYNIPGEHMYIVQCTFLAF